MADTFVKNPKLIVGTQAQVEAEMDTNDIGFATDIEFYTSKQIDELLENIGGASLPILMPIWSDHVINDMSWLRADTFSWQSGDTYNAAYEHLVGDLNTNVIENGVTYYAWKSDAPSYVPILYTSSETPSVGDMPYYYNNGEFREYEPISAVGDGYIEVLYDDIAPVRCSRFYGDIQTDTIDDITISYYLADDGHKICLPDQESNIVALYEKTGAADYYLLDTTNKQFKLPRKQKRTLIQAVKNDDGTWYNLYSDGWVEQGGFVAYRETGTTTVSLLVEMIDSNYTALFTPSDNSGTGNLSWQNVSIWNRTAISFDCRAQTDTRKFWQVSGYAAESEYASAGMRLEYYYVGNFEQTAIEQTAGLNAELFNGKADISTVNGIDSRVDTLEGYDYVVESQEPTSSNSYTWYRKYKSGWVEQGGRVTVSGTISATNVRVTFPVEMANTNYTAICANNANVGIAGYVGWESTTAMSVGTMTSKSGTTTWSVSGMAKQ